MKIKAGDIFKFQRNVDLLNFLLNRDMKAWYKCNYSYTDEIRMLFVTLNCDGNSGWINYFTKNGNIAEKYVGYINDMLPSHYEEKANYRLYFDKKIDENRKKYFEFVGLYRIISNSKTYREYTKISDEFTF